MDQIALHGNGERCWTYLTCEQAHHLYVPVERNSAEQGYREGYAAARRFYGDEATYKLGQIRRRADEFRACYDGHRAPWFVREFLERLDELTAAYADLC